MAPKSSCMPDGKNIDDEALLRLSVKDLNRILRTLSPDDRLILKRRRRILKNRGYAANCRTKRLSEKEILQIEKDKLEEEIHVLSHENQMIKMQFTSFKERFNDLKAYYNLTTSD